MCSHALARLAALTTSISRSSKRYTVQSSTKVPSGVRIPEYCTPPVSSAETSLQVTRFTKALRSGPVTSNSPMWETSKMPVPVRTAWCSAMMPVGYCTGISQPAKGTIFPPRARWMSASGVRFRSSLMLPLGFEDSGRRIADSGVSPIRSPLSAIQNQFQQQGFLDMQPVLRLIPHPAPRPLQHPLLHLFSPVGREAVEEDRARARQVHQPLGDRVPLERRPALLGVAFLAHRGPHVGAHQVGALHRFLRLFGDTAPGRSEEHTSELQSPCNLVCRLLLEKKNYHNAFLI